MKGMEVFIHIGYPKNASTMLQTDVFPKIEEVYFIGRKYIKDNSFISKDFENAIYSISFEDTFNYNHSRVEQQINRALEMIPSSKKKLVISWEAFVHNVADRGLIANRLYQLFPNARIILVIRDQIKSIISMYNFLVEQAGGNINYSYGKPSVSSLSNWIEEQKKTPYRSYLNTLKYDSIIKYYIDLFSRKNIKVLFFETLIESKQEFLDELTDFINVEKMSSEVIKKRNPSSSKLLLDTFSLRNKLNTLGISINIPKRYKSILKSLIARSSLSLPREKLSNQEKDFLVDFYKDSNQNLKLILGLEHIPFK